MHYKGTLDALKTVVKEDGVQRLYKGLSPAILRQVVFSTELELYHVQFVRTSLCTRTTFLGLTKR